MYNHSLVSLVMQLLVCPPLLHYSFFSLYLSLLHPRVCVIFSNIHISDPGNQTITQPEGPILNRADPLVWREKKLLRYDAYLDFSSLFYLVLSYRCDSPLLTTFVILLMTSFFFSFQLQKCLSQLIQVKNK